MKSHAGANFWKLFYKLPPEIQRQVYKAYEQFTQDPSHPSLNFELVNKRTGLWSVRINDEYRVLGYRKGGEMRWIWIGNHDDYMRLIPER